MEAFLKNFDLVPLDVLMIVVCSVAFVVFWQVLSQVLWKPYLQLIDAREKATVGAQEGAHEDRARAEELKRQYEEKVGAARVAAMEKKFSLLENAKREAHTLVEKAEGEAQEHVRAVRWEIGSKMEDFQKRAAQEVEGLSRIIVERAKAVKPASQSKGLN